MSQINFQSLEDFVQKEPDDISIIHLWYEKLSEFDLEGSESPKDVETVVYALRFLMNYSFTAAEELKEIAEKEAVLIAEKEEQWEEQRQSMREEIEDLRQRITSRVEASESSEAFRAQIDSLKEENRIIQQLSRDRDMEMADQRDRFEALVARADMLTRERDALQDQKAQMEDNIRELTRRISSKSEDTSQEWETKKLKLRNEQAVTLSKQMQAVVSQNDQLRMEVDRVSDALEDATRLIEDSSRRIIELTEELGVVQDSEHHLGQDNRSLIERLEVATQRLNEVETKAMDADEILKTKIQSQNESISHLQRDLYEAQIEVEELRSRIRADTTEDREAELEKLKQELVSATKMAKILLGQETSVRGESSDTTDWPRRLMQSEQRLHEAQAKIDSLRTSAAELEETIVQKELRQEEAVAELERLREMRFGDAREEFSRLQQQLRFRDEQIAKLSRHCTMLQIELGKYAEGFVPDLTSRGEVEKQKEEIPVEPISVKKPDRIGNQRPKLIEKKTGGEPVVTRPRPVRPRLERSLDEYEHQAMIIAGLNFEIYQLLQELESKDGQLVELEHSLKLGKKAVDEGRAKLKVAYEEVANLRKSTDNDEVNTKEENTIELMELRRFSETIRLGGTETERRTEEVTRKLIAERINKARLIRSESNLRARCGRATEAARKFRERLVSARTEGEKRLARLQFDLDATTYDMAVAQNRLLHSVPMKLYDELSRKYRELLKRDTLGAGTIEEPTGIEFDILPSQPEESAQELLAKNQYLKKIVEILTEQNEFWNSETEILQRENNELKLFLEDLENENDAKGVLVSIESRLMETIRELSTIAKEHSRGHKKMRDAEESLARQKGMWSAERKRYIHVISLLQQGYQNQKNNNIATITVTQMELLRQRIVEIGYEKSKLEEEKEQAEKIRKELEVLRIQTESETKTEKLIATEQGNLHRLDRLLRQYMAGEAEQMAKAQRLERLVSLKEKQEKQKLEEIEDLQKANEELLGLVSMSKARVDEKAEPQKTAVQNTDAEESAYEMDFDSASSEDPSPRNSRIVVKTIIEDNSKEYEKRLSKMRETAETCIRSYKEQLAQKDTAIESYRQLLLVKIEERRSEQVKEKIVIREEKKVDREADKKLRLAVTEIARLKEDVEDLEAANRELFRERRKSTIPLVEDTETQTEWDDGDRESEVSARPRLITPIIEETERSEIDTVDDSKQNENIRLKSEIRRLQERIRRLTARNKELVLACEQIKEEAITQLASKKQREVDQEEEDITQTKLEVVKLRNDIRTLRSKLKETQDLNDRLKTSQGTGKKSSEDEVQKWEQKKKAEDKLRILSGKLKESEQRESETRDRLTKREKRLEELQEEVRNRHREIEKLNRRLQEMKTEKEVSVKDNQRQTALKEQQSVLEERLRQKDRELIVINSKLKSSEKKVTDLRQEVVTLKRSVETRVRETASTSEVKQTTVVVDTKVREKLEEELKQTKKQLRLAEIRLAETCEKLEFAEKDLVKSQSDYERMMKKYSLREDNGTGAVAVLKDKLLAKDREIAQCKSKIAQLERRLSQ